jgi:hypothetical protein
LRLRTQSEARGSRPETTPIICDWNLRGRDRRAGKKRADRASVMAANTAGIQPLVLKPISAQVLAGQRLRPDLKIVFMTGYYSRAAAANGLGKLLLKPAPGAGIDTERRSLLAGA